MSAKTGPFRVLVVDDQLHGHHTTYLAAMAEACEGSPVHIDFLLPAKPDDLRDIAAQRIGEKGFSGKIFYWEPPLAGKRTGRIPGSMFPRQWLSSCARRCEEISSNGRPYDLVFFAWLDSLLLSMRPARLLLKDFHLPFSGIWFQPRAWRIPLKGWKRFFLRRDPILRHRQCRGAMLLDEVLQETIEKFYQKPFEFFPDITETRLANDTEAFWGWPDIQKAVRNRMTVLLTGQLGRRKGIYPFVEQVKRGKAGNYHFLMAGPWEPGFDDEGLVSELKCMSDDREVPFSFLSGRLQETEMNQLIHGADLIWAWYPKFFYGSNVMTKAAVLGKPVVVAPHGLMADRVRERALGYVVAESEFETFFSKPLPDIKGFSDATAQYAKEHSMKSLQQNFPAFLGRLCSLKTS